ncbi:hypothetical protein FM036_45615 [Nostoc sp. HG1]|nr:hypothetical protein [Nostoc sp. HG1]
MAEPTLADVFGTGATQDAATLTIQKSALTDVGLTTSATNTAESLLTAILLKAKQTLTTANHDANINQSITITDGFIPSFVLRGEAKYTQDTLTVTLEKAAGSTVINPNDY